MPPGWVAVFRIVGVVIGVGMASYGVALLTGFPAKQAASVHLVISCYVIIVELTQLRISRGG